MATLRNYYSLASTFRRCCSSDVAKMEPDDGIPIVGQLACRRCRPRPSHHPRWEIESPRTQLHGNRLDKSSCAPQVRRWLYEELLDGAIHENFDTSRPSHPLPIQLYLTLVHFPCESRLNSLLRHLPPLQKRLWTMASVPERPLATDAARERTPLLARQWEYQTQRRSSENASTISSTLSSLTSSSDSSSSSSGVNVERGRPTDQETRDGRRLSKAEMTKVMLVLLIGEFVSAFSTPITGYLPCPRFLKQVPVVSLVCVHVVSTRTMTGRSLLPVHRRHIDMAPHLKTRMRSCLDYKLVYELSNSCGLLQADWLLILCDDSLCSVGGLQRRAFLAI
jgi:hypothetical protein